MDFFGGSEALIQRQELDEQKRRLCRENTVRLTEWPYHIEPTLGVGSVILGMPKAAFHGEKADEIRKRLACPEGSDFVVAIALGYATDMMNAHDLRYDHISRVN